MRFFRPKSFLVLVLIGFAVVTLPLLLALVNAEIFMARLAQRSSEALHRSVTVIQGSRNLVEELLALERRVRQYQVLGDPELLQDISDKHRQFGQTIDQLQALIREEKQQKRLMTLKSEEGTLYQLWLDGPTAGKALVERFALLTARAQQIYEESQELIVQEAEAMQQATRRARKLLSWLPLALVPVTALIVALFAALIAKPIRQIDQSINRLGEGDFKKPIQVGGPRDLEFLGRRLDWLRVRLGEVERDKSKFVAHVSHELKTPLASLREGSELLAEEAVGPLSEQQREVVTILQRNGLQLQKLIDNLLGFSRAQAKVTPYRRSQIDLAPLIESVLEDHRATVMKKEIELELALDDIHIWGDLERLRTVVDNLLSNAVKFTPPDGTILVRLADRGEQALLEVADSGPGISDAERSRIYEPFIRGTPLRGAGERNRPRTVYCAGICA
ncbi:MAG: histidine kinase dimerization/phospho-acceptor domain-containing protein [Syntrophotaleaceae bacterium]